MVVELVEILFSTPSPSEFRAARNSRSVQLWSDSVEYWVKGRGVSRILMRKVKSRASEVKIRLPVKTEDVHAHREIRDNDVEEGKHAKFFSSFFAEYVMCEIAPDPKTFFPAIEGNLTKIVWAHAVNSQANLSKALLAGEFIFIIKNVIFLSTRENIIPTG